MKKQVYPIGQSFGDIAHLQDCIEKAIINGATDYFIPIEKEKDGTIHARWIEFYREVPIGELEKEKAELIRKLKEVNDKIDYEMLKG